MKPLIIGVAGGTGSGKSTVARNVASALGEASVAFIDMDAYYKDHAQLPFDLRKAVNWDHPNAFDWDLLVQQLTDLSEGRAIEKPVYDFHNHVRSPTGSTASRSARTTTSRSPSVRRSWCCASAPSFAA
jgi:uridine kinase